MHHGPRLGEWEAEHGSIVAAQVAAALTESWSPDLRELVRSVTTDDFVVDSDPFPADSARIAAAQDLLATARVAA